MDAVLVYDRDCGVCRFAKDLVRALDLGDRIRAVALQDPESDRLLGRMSEGDRWDSFHFVRDDQVTSRGDGVVEILGALPLGRGIPRLAAEVPVLRGASSRLYRLFHGVRDGLACGVSARRGCAAPSGSA